MLKETETEKNSALLFLYFYHWLHFDWGKVLPLPLPGYAYDEIGSKKLRHGKCHLSSACNTSLHRWSQIRKSLIRK